MKFFRIHAGECDTIVLQGLAYVYDLGINMWLKPLEPASLTGPQPVPLRPIRVRKTPSSALYKIRRFDLFLHDGHFLPIIPESDDAFRYSPPGLGIPTDFLDEYLDIATRTYGIGGSLQLRVTLSYLSCRPYRCLLGYSLSVLRAGVTSLRKKSLLTKPTSQTV